MKNLILIIGNNKYQFDNLDDIYTNIIGKKQENYNELSDAEKNEKRYQIAYLNANCNPELIGYLNQTPSEEIANAKKIFVDNDKVYLLSILKAGIATLLANKEHPLVKNIEAKANKDNYIIVNSFANELLNQCKKDLGRTEDISGAKNTEHNIKPDLGIEK